MKTKIIFSALALAMLLATACNKNETDIEEPNQKGYALPVTVNATRQGDAATKATYNESTRKLEFSAGDKLFVYSSASGAGKYAGALDYVPATGKFSGTIYTQNDWTDTADALFSTAFSARAILLPAGYESYNFLSISNNNPDVAYDDVVSGSIANAFVASETAKKTGVEQLSWEQAYTYSSGFALAPANAVLNFTISGLEAGAKTVTLITKYSGMDYDQTVSGSVTPNASGVATFAIGVSNNLVIKNVANNLTVGSSKFTLPGGTALEAGKIYNITRAAAPVSLIVNPAVGQVIGNDGKNYADAAAATSAGATAVAKIVYVGSDNGEAAPYNHGLALALNDANGGSSCKWKTSQADAGHTKQTSNTFTEESGLQYNAMHNSEIDNYPAFKYAIANNGTAAPTGCSSWFLASGYQWKQKIGAAGLSNLGLQGGANYWTSTEYDANEAWYFFPMFSSWNHVNKDLAGARVRACLAF